MVVAAGLRWILPSVQIPVWVAVPSLFLWFLVFRVLGV
jgi:hypothetical protein